jgi:hypothetical protein
MSFGVIEHFTEEKDVEKIISEAKRVTKDRFFISVPYLSKGIQQTITKKADLLQIDQKAFYQYYYSKEEIFNLLQHHGLKPIHHQFYSTYIGLKRHHPVLKKLLKNSVFRYTFYKNPKWVDLIFGSNYAHMIGIWAVKEH